ncbi:leukocyte surface antigen CD53-like [Paramacrobiotus metropolitanus]|uniref:leukocyte surface antigen CD53-like n=1 Tax=Paramacrobiotus metropolitanus TaxID=2943436 RepID=UPI002445A3DB|nr:leukocyte surface antigen CD53-like [Paramacrobiotus metropolitanus]
MAKKPLPGQLLFTPEVSSYQPESFTSQPLASHLGLLDKKEDVPVSGRRYRPLRWLVMFFSVSFILIGLLLVGGAVYTKQRFTGSAEFHWAVWLSLLSGGLLMLAGFAGSFGVGMRSFCVVVSTALFLAIIVAAFLTTTLIIKDEMVNACQEVEVALRLAIVNYNPNDRATTYDLDTYQRRFRCCGANSPADWLATSFQMIPDSCPHPIDLRRGCTVVITAYVKKMTTYVIIVLGTLTGYLFLGFLAIAFLAWVHYRSRL